MDRLLIYSNYDMRFNYILKDTTENIVDALKYLVYEEHHSYELDADIYVSKFHYTQEYFLDELFEIELFIRDIENFIEHSDYDDIVKVLECVEILKSYITENQSKN